MQRLRRIRDTLLFFGGLLGLLHEAFLTHLDRPNLILAFLAMMGLPFFTKKRGDDEK